MVFKQGRNLKLAILAGKYKYIFKVELKKCNVYTD